MGKRKAGDDKEEENIENLNQEIGIGEVEAAWEKMKNKKAAGEDGLIVELLKGLPRRWKEELAKIINEVYKEERII